ncbi:hypothetical protein [Xylophilus ampelinus]|uniref:Uncharacterized protein n=1 Tax=Xylophilus ampelinus TaxID=54067 RepID=A0A318SXU0_9BURK|nr:hypothetical protein [Xylophilus ampelinus]MCS4509125.1 hypothetical protein [Xylophilus ampelinus]PYE79847.1 hypothetical protein DFQ15_101167 [Xylophilus ampelinus]
MSATLFRRLVELLPSDPQLFATVEAVHSDGTATVVLPGGGRLRVRNPLELTAAATVYVQGGAITGDAPNLPLVEIEI